MNYVILIPAYEPDNKLLKLLSQIDNEYPVVLINDGSDKAYNNIFNAASKYAHVISYNENRGKGYAIKTGLNYIDDTYDDYIVVTMDADGQHILKDALRLCDFVKENPYTLALGMRRKSKHTPLRSRIGNYVIRKVFNRITKNNIYDTQTGLRAFSYKLTDYMLNIKGYRFEYEMNVLLNLKDNHIKYQEIPIEAIYLDHNKDSHFNSLSDSYAIYKTIHKYKRSKHGK